MFCGPRASVPPLAMMTLMNPAFCFSTTSLEVSSSISTSSEGGLPICSAFATALSDKANVPAKDRPVINTVNLFISPPRPRWPRARGILLHLDHRQFGRQPEELAVTLDCARHGAALRRGQLLVGRHIDVHDVRLDRARPAASQPSVDHQVIRKRAAGSRRDVGGTRVIDERRAILVGD